MRRRQAARNMPLDLDEILEAKAKEETVPTTVRLPVSMAQAFKRIAEARKMSQAKLLRNLVAALIRDYEEQHGAKRR